jgi:hypothetical protein
MRPSANSARRFRRRHSGTPHQLRVGETLFGIAPRARSDSGGAGRAARSDRGIGVVHHPNGDARAARRLFEAAGQRDSASAHYAIVARAGCRRFIARNPSSGAERRSRHTGPERAPSDSNSCHVAFRRRANCSLQERSRPLVVSHQPGAPPRRRREARRREEEPATLIAMTDAMHRDGQSVQGHAYRRRRDL